MNIHVFQHVAFEGLGSIAAWAAAREARVTYTRCHEDAVIPTLNGVDLLIAMGGPMSANDDGEFPWLTSEKRCIREAVRRGVPTLGVCLGAQLIASALGARVYRQREKEIGWFPVIADTTTTPLLPRQMTVFHWHGETFDLPAGAVRLASSVACENQAFQVGERTLGLQFHLEATPQSVAALVEHCRHELTSGRFVQAEEQILEVPASAFAPANRVMDRLLSRLVAA